MMKHVSVRKAATRLRRTTLAAVVVSAGVVAVAPYAAAPQAHGAPSSPVLTVPVAARTTVHAAARAARTTTVWSDRRVTVRMSVSAGHRLPAGRFVVLEGRRFVASAHMRAGRRPSTRVRLPRLAPGRHVLTGILEARSGAALARTTKVVVSRNACQRGHGHCAAAILASPAIPEPPVVLSDPACRTSAVWSRLARCGWPGPGNTGFPYGQRFDHTVTGGLVVTTNNAVIDGYRVSGGIQVRAQNVTIRNSWITDSEGGRSGSGVVNINPGYSATVEHNLIDGLNATHACIWDEGSSMTAVANNCQHTNDGIFSWSSQVGVDGTGDNFVIEDNWLHSFTTHAANGHIDGYQTEGTKNGVIRHNTIDVSQTQDSDIAIWDSRNNSSNILVDHNLMAGGGFSVYAEDYSPSESAAAGGYSVTNIRFTDNVFSRVHFGCVGAFGVWYTRGIANDGWHRSGNTLLEARVNIDAANPMSGGYRCS